MRHTGFYFRRLWLGDVKLVRRDIFLLGMPFYPLVAALVMYLMVPWVSGLLMDSIRFDLEPYYSLIVGFMVFMLTPMMIGMIMGFLFIDERDEHTLIALLVTSAFYTLVSGLSDYLSLFVEPGYHRSCFYYYWAY